MIAPEGTAANSAEAVEVTPELLARYDRRGPRYTSYPPVPFWPKDFAEADYVAALERAGQQTDEPVSLYVHVPFCRERCTFCGCNVIISKKAGVAETYLGYVAREIEMVARLLGGRRGVEQLHWGGGTPTFLSLGEMRTLYASIMRHFAPDADAEIAIEVGPRVTSQEQIALLRELGFNRLSMGVQDLDPIVQEEINRGQTEEQTRTLVESSRAAGFESVSMDLVYGLPGQRRETWEQTVKTIAKSSHDGANVGHHCLTNLVVAVFSLSNRQSWPTEFELLLLCFRFELLRSGVVAEIVRFTIGNKIEAFLVVFLF